MKKQKNIAIGGVFSALSLVLLYIASVSPSLRLSLTAMSGILISIVIIKTNIKTGVCLFASVSLLSFLFLPIKSMAVIYVFCFGSYSLVKFFLERLKKPLFEWALKLLFANLSLVVLLFFAKLFISLPNVSLWVLVPVFQLVFIAYDIAFTQILSIYAQRFNNKW